jgi:nitroimidazol reductase NimA-like FMN-containing flavoprotein (pyridoxamine 5'-phosphate oxidase superfamily)
MDLVNSPVNYNICFTNKNDMEQISPTERTTITRLANRGNYDADVIRAILKEGLICHISFVHEGQPYLLPNMYGIKDNTIFIHGSVGSFLQRSLAQEMDLCFSVTLLDGLVLARSAFHHSANYRSVVLFGKARRVESDEEKMQALEILTEHIIPGRWKEVRLPTKSELKKTMVLAIPLNEASAKIRTGPPVDDEEDYGLDVWAGQLPLRLQSGEPIADARLKTGIQAPLFITKYQRE